MDNQTINYKRIYTIATIYYLCCGLSAILLPESWLILAGVDLSELRPFTRTMMAICGTLLLGIASGLYYSIKVSSFTLPVAFVVLFSNIFDLIVIIIAYFMDQISFSGLLVFFVLDTFWIVLFANIISNLNREIKNS